MTTAPAVGPPPVLIVTGDPDLLDDLLRLAAAAAIEPQVAPDLAAARPKAVQAALVLLGRDQLDAAARHPLPSRGRIVVVCPANAEPPPAEPARQAGAHHVAHLPAADGWLVETIVDAARTAAVRRPGRLVAVVGGRGGAGASVLACALAVTAARDETATLLVDADPAGGGLDLMLGWEERPGLRWPQLVTTSGRVDPSALLGALPGRDRLRLLSCGRGADQGDDLPGAAMATALDAGRHGCELTVVDLARHADDAARLVLRTADRVLVVVPAEIRGAAAATRVIATARRHGADPLVVIRLPSPGRLPASDIAALLDVPLAGTVRTEQHLASGMERGQAPAADGRGRLADLCRRLLGDLP